MTGVTRACAGAVTLAVVLGAAACGEGPPPLPEADPDDIAPAPAAPGAELAAEEAPPALADEQLAFGTYFLPSLGNAPIRLRDGEWLDEAAGRVVTLASSPRVRLDVDEDGEPEAVVVLTVGSATGVRSHLVSVGVSGGRAVQEATADLGGSSVVRSMRTEGRELVLEIIRPPAPDRPPTGGRAVPPPEEQRWSVEGGAWVQRTP